MPTQEDFVREPGSSCSQVRWLMLQSEPSYAEAKLLQWLSFQWAFDTGVELWSVENLVLIAWGTCHSLLQNSFGPLLKFGWGSIWLCMMLHNISSQGWKHAFPMKQAASRAGLTQLMRNETSNLKSPDYVVDLGKKTPFVPISLQNLTDAQSLQEASTKCLRAKCITIWNWIARKTARERGFFFFLLLLM